MDHVRTWLEVDSKDGALVLFVGMDVRYALELENDALEEIFQRAIDFNAGLGVKVDRTCLRVFHPRKARQRP